MGLGSFALTKCRTGYRSPEHANARGFFIGGAMNTSDSGRVEGGARGVGVGQTGDERTCDELVADALAEVELLARVNRAAQAVLGGKEESP